MALFIPGSAFQNIKNSKTNYAAILPMLEKEPYHGMREGHGMRKMEKRPKKRKDWADTEKPEEEHGADGWLWALCYSSKYSCIQGAHVAYTFIFG